MVAAREPGAIVATGSVSGIVSDRGIVNYSTSKAAVLMLRKREIMIHVPVIQRATPELHVTDR